MGLRTIPRPQIDLSKYGFRTYARPDGHEVQIESTGEICIPHLLPLGGIELPPLQVSGKTLRLQAFGDSGFGTPEQYEVGANIVAMADKRGVHANFHVGDIIYPNGIVGPCDPNGKAFHRKVYWKLREQHAIPGNHEYGFKAAGVPEAWVQASWLGLTGAPKMPARYYSRRFFVDGMTVRVLFLDTNTLAVDPIQLKWIKREVQKTQDKLVVVGHHTIHSGGNRWSLPHMEELLLPIIDKKADLYVCGHEHALQFLKSPQGLPQLISGSAGVSPGMKPNGRAEFFDPRMGTAFIDISRKGIDVEIVDGKSCKSLFKKHLPTKTRA